MYLRERFWIGGAQRAHFPIFQSTGVQRPSSQWHRSIATRPSSCPRQRHDIIVNRIVSSTIENSAVSESTVRSASRPPGKPADAPYGQNHIFALKHTHHRYTHPNHPQHLLHPILTTLRCSPNTYPSYPPLAT